MTKLWLYIVQLCSLAQKLTKLEQFPTIGNLPASHYASMKLVGKSHHHFAASCWARAVAGLRGVNKDLTAIKGDLVPL